MLDSLASTADAAAGTASTAAEEVGVTTEERRTLDLLAVGTLALVVATKTLRVLFRAVRRRFSEQPAAAGEPEGSSVGWGTKVFGGLALTALAAEHLPIPAVAGGAFVVALALHAKRALDGEGGLVGVVDCLTGGLRARGILPPAATPEGGRERLIPVKQGAESPWSLLGPVAIGSAAVSAFGSEHLSVPAVAAGALAFVVTYALARALGHGDVGDGFAGLQELRAVLDFA